MTTFADIFKKGFLAAAGNLTLEHFAMSLLVSFICGAMIFLVYRFFFQGVVYNNNFNILLVMTCMVTCFIVMVISSNVVLSLGMVGALSIVRFRSAIKEPLDTGFLFWAISCGITAGAGLYLISLCAVVCIALVFILLAQTKGRSHAYLLVVRFRTEAAADVQRALGSVKKELKNKTSLKNVTELTYEVRFKGGNTAFADQLAQIEGVESATVVEFTGDYCA